MNDIYWDEERFVYVHADGTPFTFDECEAAGLDGTLRDPVRLCDQGCGKPAECYAMGPHANDWGGHYCLDDAAKLGWRPIDQSRYPMKASGD